MGCKELQITYFRVMMK